mmetsp:Transcript_4315/g.13025  ORF Transcript_4315/g.13025 Transcript_4315/m.13025 type:complete len:125 (+) Transcript_4315:1180-1554(+)
MRLRKLLSREAFPPEVTAAPVVCQYSSLGSLGAKWLFEEFGASLCTTQEPAPLGDAKAKLQLVWPTVEQVGRVQVQPGNCHATHQDLRPLLRIEDLFRAPHLCKPLRRRLGLAEQIWEVHGAVV